MRKELAQLEHQLAEEYLSTRPNLELRNPGFCVFFAAPPGSGKSTLRRTIVDKLRATYFCNDEVRELIAKHSSGTPAPNIGNIVLETWSDILNHSHNRFVVFDNTISNYHFNPDSYLNTARRRHLPVYIVSIELPKKVLQARIVARGINVEPLLEELDSALEAHKAAVKSVTVDFTLASDDTVDDLLADIQRRLIASHTH